MSYPTVLLASDRINPMSLKAHHFKWKRFINNDPIIDVITFALYIIGCIW